MTFLDQMDVDGGNIYRGEFSISIMISDPDNGNAFVRALWQDVHTDVDPQTELQMMFLKPSCMFWTPDFPFKVIQGMTVTNQKTGKQYFVRESRPTGEGGTELILDDLELDQADN